MVRQKKMMTKKYFGMLLGGTLTMMVVSILLMSDSIIAGIVIGADAVAGITLVTPIYSLSAFFGSVFSLGIPIIYSTEMGKFNKEAADHAFGFGILMSLVVGVVLFLVTTFCGDAYLQSCNPPAAVLAQAQGYLSWMRFTILVLPMQMLFAAMVYSDGDEILSTAGNLTQAIGNVAASVLLSHLMGIRGIGLASFLFNVISLMVLLLHFLKDSNSLRWNLYFSGAIFKDVTRFGLIDSSTYLFLALLTLIMNTFISTWFGAEYLILVSVVAVCREIQMVFDGIGEAITPIMSVYVGEENRSGVRYIYNIALKSAVAEGLVVMAAMMLCAPVVPVLLGIEVPELVGYAVPGIRIYALGSVFVSLLYLITSYYLIIEKITLGIIASALRDVIVPSLMAVILGMAFGIEGMFTGFAAAPALAYLLLRTVMILRRGKENWPLLLSELPGNAESYMYNLETEPEQIIGLQKDVGDLLAEKGYDRRTVGRAKLLIEELFMLIREKNGDKAILAECSILLRPEGVQVITRDEGILFNLSEDDVTVTSIVSLTVSAYMEKLGDNRRYLTTMSFNRSSYVIPTESEQREDS